MTAAEILWGAVVFVLWVAAGYGVLYMISLFVDSVDAYMTRRREQRRADLERALDQRQAELRQTVLALAEALAEERLAATRASERMAARAYLTTGRVP